MKFRPLLYFSIPLVLLAALLFWYTDDGYSHSNYYGEGTLYYTIVNKGECNVKIKGDINDALERNFSDFIKESEESGCLSYLLTLNSNGGTVGISLKLGNLIREKKMTTIVLERCKSSCLYLFISGTTRIAHKNSVLGMHQAVDYKSKECINPKLNTKNSRDFYVGLFEFAKEKLGAKAGKFFISKNNTAGCREMLEVDNNEFLKEGVINKLIVE
jgi:membrane-bound ClpP family serine protease